MAATFTDPHRANATPDGAYWHTVDFTTDVVQALHEQAQSGARASGVLVSSADRTNGVLLVEQVEPFPFAPEDPTHSVVGLYRRIAPRQAVDPAGDVASLQKSFGTTPAILLLLQSITEDETHGYLYYWSNTQTLSPAGDFTVYPVPAASSSEPVEAAVPEAAAPSRLRWVMLAVGLAIVAALVALAYQKWQAQPAASVPATAPLAAGGQPAPAAAAPPPAEPAARRRAEFLLEPVAPSRVRGSYEPPRALQTPMPDDLGLPRPLDVRLWVDKHGVAVRARLMDASLSPKLADQAYRTLRRWRFAPARQDGRPAESQVVVHLR